MRQNKNKDKAQERNDSQNKTRTILEKTWQQYAKGHWGGRDKLKQVNKCSKHDQKPNKIKNMNPKGQTKVHNEGRNNLNIWARK